MKKLFFILTLFLVQFLIFYSNYHSVNNDNNNCFNFRFNYFNTIVILLIYVTSNLYVLMNNLIHLIYLYRKFFLILLHVFIQKHKKD